MDDDIRRDVEVAAKILREAGATEVYVFGSAAKGEARPDSDIDLAIRGIPPERYFRAMSKVTLALTRPIDLIDLDAPSPFTEFLIRKGRLQRVG